MTKFRSYKKRRSYGLVIFVVFLAALLSAASPHYIRYVFTSVVYPFQYVAASLWKGMANTPSFFINLRNLSRDNKLLREELKVLQAKQALYAGLELENQRLEKALSFQNKSVNNLKLRAAQVVGRSSSPWFSILHISKGSRSGIRVDMPVIVEEGVVGRVVEVSPFSSKVMLLTDAESSVAAVDSRSRDFGVIMGGLPNKLFMKYVGAGGDVKVGDIILTSQISTIFPSGLPIGTVSQASKMEHDLFYQIKIKPAVDFSRIEEVFVCAH